MNGPVVLAIVLTISALLVAAYLLLEDLAIERSTRRDVKTLHRHEEARRRLSAPRSLP